MKSHPAVLLALVTLLTGSATADLKTETLTRASLLTGIGTTEVLSSTAYQGEKRTESQTTKVVGGIGGALAGKPQTSVEITRLDKDLVWDLNPAKKTYTERPIAMSAQTEVRTGRRQSGPDQGKPYKIVKSELKVNKTGEKKDINGFPCEEYVVTWEVVLEDTASKGTVTQVMTTDLWNTPLTDKLKQTREIESAFSRSYAKRLGRGLSPEETDRLGAGMLTSMYGLDSKETAGKLEQVGKELTKIEGYSIVTEVKWQVKADSAAAQKPAHSHGGEATPEPEPAPTGLRGMIANKLVPKPAAKPTEENVVFSSYHEVKSVSLDPISETEFEIPDGYKKVEEKK
jgi:hypothetical protein